MKGNLFHALVAELGRLGAGETTEHIVKAAILLDDDDNVFKVLA